MKTKYAVPIGSIRCQLVFISISAFAAKHKAKHKLNVTESQHNSTRHTLMSGIVAWSNDEDGPNHSIASSDHISDH